MYLDNQILVFSADSNSNAERSEALLTMLTTEDQKRAQKYRSESSKALFVLGRCLLRLVFSPLIGINPSPVKVSHSMFGKPEFRNTNFPRFNLAHSGALCLLVVSDSDTQNGFYWYQIETFLNPLKFFLLVSDSDIACIS